MTKSHLVKIRKKNDTFSFSLNSNVWKYDISKKIQWLKMNKFDARWKLGNRLGLPLNGSKSKKLLINNDPD